MVCSPCVRSWYFPHHSRSASEATTALGHSLQDRPRPLVHKCPLCINTDRKFWALGLVAMCQEETYATRQNSLIFRPQRKVRRRFEFTNKQFGDRIERSVLKRHDGMRSRLRAQIDRQRLKGPLPRIVVQDRACNDRKETPGRQKVISYMHRVSRNVFVGHRKAVRTKCVGDNAADHVAFGEDPG